MASPAQSLPSKEVLIAKLKEGPTAWNAWLNGVSLEVLRSIDLSDFDLSGCNLRGALLGDINFAGTSLFETELREADLRGADLSKAKGCLLARQFAGTDLTGAKLPQPLESLYDKLGSVREISDSAKKLFLALLAGCLYSWLTIATTKDVDLITNRASSPLPIIQTAIPIVGFYVVAPVILLCIYFYFHFYLQKLWEELASLPAIFPDGRALYQRADPWLFNDLVRAHFVRLKKGRPFLSYFQQWLSIVLAWWIVPITLLLFWGRYLPRHNLVWTLVLACILAFSIVSAIRLYQLASNTLRGKERLSFAKTIRGRDPYINALLLCFFSATFMLLSVGAIRRMQVDHRRALTWYDPIANLENADISVKPSDWTGKNEQEFDHVKGARLLVADLREARAGEAFLVRADLRGSNLRNAIFINADLRQADLSWADLSGTAMMLANLEGALMRETNVSNVWWGRANIRYADLDRAENLDPERIRSSQNWQMAFYDPDTLKKLGLPPDNNDAVNAYRGSKSEELFDSWVQKWRQQQKKTTKTK